MKITAQFFRSSGMLRRKKNMINISVYIRTSEKYQTNNLRKYFKVLKIQIKKTQKQQNERKNTINEEIKEIEPEKN